MSEYFDPTLIYLKSINKNVAKSLIEKNHYTHKWSLCTVAYGVYYKEFEGDSNFTVEKVAKSRILKVINIEQ